MCIRDRVYLTQELNHSVNFSSSVFILKDNGANLKFTFPEGTQFGKTIKGDPLTTEIKHGNFLLIDGNLNYNIRKENQSTSTGNSFFYPTVKNATWEISPTKTGSLEGAINFKVKAEPSVSYRITFDLTKKKEVELLKTHDQESVSYTHLGKKNNAMATIVEVVVSILCNLPPVAHNANNAIEIHNSFFSSKDIGPIASRIFASCTSPPTSSLNSGFIRACVKLSLIHIYGSSRR